MYMLVHIIYSDKLVRYTTNISQQHIPNTTTYTCLII